MSNVLYFRGEVSHENTMFLVEGTYDPGDDFNYWSDDRGPQVTIQAVHRWCPKNEVFLPPSEEQDDFIKTLEKAVVDQDVYLFNQRD